MKIYIAGIAGVVLLFTACTNSKKEEEKTGFISVVSLVRNQVAHVDTSFYAIIKTVSTEGLDSDTVHLKREEFRNAASEFLKIPDLSDPNVAKRYKEEPPRYDRTIGRAIFSYSAIDPTNEEYTSQELLMTLSPTTGDKVSSIIVNRSLVNRDSSVQKNMLWQIDKSFQIVTISRKPGEPEKTVTTKVIWE